MLPLSSSPLKFTWCPKRPVQPLRSHTYQLTSLPAATNLVGSFFYYVDPSTGPLPSVLPPLPPPLSFPHLGHSHLSYPNLTIFFPSLFIKIKSKSLIPPQRPPTIWLLHLTLASTHLPNLGQVWGRENSSGQGLKYSYAFLAISHPVKCQDGLEECLPILWASKSPYYFLSGCLALKNKQDLLRWHSQCELIWDTEKGQWKFQGSQGTGFPATVRELWSRTENCNMQARWASLASPETFIEFFEPSRPGGPTEELRCPKDPLQMRKCCSFGEGKLWWIQRNHIRRVEEKSLGPRSLWQTDLRVAPMFTSCIIPFPWMWTGPVNCF